MINNLIDILKRGSSEEELEKALIRASDALKVAARADGAAPHIPPEYMQQLAAWLTGQLQSTSEASAAQSPQSALWVSNRTNVAEVLLISALNPRNTVLLECPHSFEVFFKALVAVSERSRQVGSGGNGGASKQQWEQLLVLCASTIKVIWDSMVAKGPPQMSVCAALIAVPGAQRALLHAGLADASRAAADRTPARCNAISMLVDYCHPEERATNLRVIASDAETAAMALDVCALRLQEAPQSAPPSITEARSTVTVVLLCGLMTHEVGCALWLERLEQLLPPIISILGRGPFTAAAMQYPLHLMGMLLSTRTAVGKRAVAACGDGMAAWLLQVASRSGDSCSPGS